ncbi:MAG: hypothetical protein WAU88_14770 [Candidatus Zixiibacteriota bacterium]
MSEYLDHQNFPRLLEKSYGEGAMLRARSVGRGGEYASGYFDIVRFFGPKAISPERIKITHQAEPFAFSDHLVAEFSHQIEAELRKCGRIYDGPKAMKLVSASFEASAGELLVQPANYGDQAGSCFALDYPSDLFAGYGGTLREYLFSKNPNHDLESNPLAICLGGAAYAVVVDRGKPYLLQVERSGKLASLENSLGPSVAGSVDWETDSTNLLDLLTGALVAEAKEELGWDRQEFELIPLAYAREILRGERPQLFAYLVTRMSCEKIAARLGAIPESKREISGYSFVPFDGGMLSQGQIARLNFEAKTAYYLLEEALALA